MPLTLVFWRMGIEGGVVGSMGERAIPVHIRPRKVAGLLLLVAFVLTFISGVAQETNILLGAGRNPLLSLLFVGEDDSLPSWFSAVMLLACSVLMVLIAHAGSAVTRTRPFHWWGLGVIFF